MAGYISSLRFWRFQRGPWRIFGGVRNFTCNKGCYDFEILGQQNEVGSSARADYTSIRESQQARRHARD